MSRPDARGILADIRTAAGRELRRRRSRRAQAAGLCVVGAVATALVVLAIELPQTVHRLGSTASRNSALSLADREVAGGNAVLADQLLAFEARAIIPADASYRVATGPRLTKQAALPITSLEGWLTYFLMPRRPASDSLWVICYGCDPAELRGYQPLWQDEYGISIGRTGS